MISREDKSIRLNMVDMHQFFIDKIDDAMAHERYIEASWLIYSCMENRFFRVLEKFKNQCKYCTGKCKERSNRLSISTKIKCVKRLLENNVECISESFTSKQLEDISSWLADRNKKMHNLLSLETYKNVDTEFKKSATKGRAILDDLYESCTKFRSKFFDPEYIFIFPEAAMEKCPCNKKRGN